MKHCSYNVHDNFSMPRVVTVKFPFFSSQHSKTPKIFLINYSAGYKQAAPCIWEAVTSKYLAVLLEKWCCCIQYVKTSQSAVWKKQNSMRVSQIHTVYSIGFSEKESKTASLAVTLYKIEMIYSIDLDRWFPTFCDLKEKAVLFVFFFLLCCIIWKIFKISKISHISLIIMWALWVILRFSLYKVVTNNLKRVYFKELY